MSTSRFTEDFEIDAIKQITERGYSVSDVSQRLGVNTHSLYAWMKRYSASPGVAASDDQSSEIRRLKQELACVTEERDILKKQPRTSPRMQSEVRAHQGASRAVQHSCHVSDALCSSERILCLAQEPFQQKGHRRSAAD